MARGKPSHPNTHTRSKLESSFLSDDPDSDLAKLRDQVKREQAGQGKLKPSGCGSTTPSSEIFPKVGLSAYFKTRAEVIASLSEEEIAFALARVRRSRNIERGRFSSAYKPRQDTSPENLDPHGDIQRQRVNSPFTLPVEIRNRIELAEAALKDGSHPEPPIKPTRLDHVLTERGRQALERYIWDRSVELESRKGNDTGLAGWRPSPLTPEKAFALDRIDFVHRALCPEDRLDLRNFTRMVLAVDDRPAMSDTEFGSRIIHYDQKVSAEGAYLGVMARLASRLYHILWAFQTASRPREPEGPQEDG
jgi:hypothetical protein